MTLGGEMNDRPWLLPLQQIANQFAVTDVTVNETVLGVIGYAEEIPQVAGVSQFVEIHHRRTLARQPLQHKIRADESSPSGHHYRTICHSLHDLKALLQG